MERTAIGGRLEWILWIVALFAFSAVGASWARSVHAQKRGAEEFRELLRTPRSLPADTKEDGSVFGRIDIERLGLSAIAFEGTGSATLAKGVGHVPGTGSSADHRNLVLAAHRDTFFRPLRDIRKGDLIHVITVDGSHAYVVRNWEIVEPSAVEVLLTSKTPMLTLVTCYPFTFVGTAPRRFVVHAVAAGK